MSRGAWIDAAMKKRFHDKWSNLVLFVITLSWFLSLFLAPLTIPGHSVDLLDGHSNIREHGDKFNKMPIYPRIIYYSGDILCHQKYYRSFYINNNQMPVCARCVSVYFGLTVGIMVTFFIREKNNSREYVLRILPDNLEKWWLIGFLGDELSSIIIVLLFLFPIALDGGLQLITSYESNNILRLITGFPAGFIGGILAGAIVNAKKKRAIKSEF
jgi:uncharacterized membrane protein